MITWLLVKHAFQFYDIVSKWKPGRQATKAVMRSVQSSVGNTRLSPITMLYPLSDRLKITQKEVAEGTKCDFNKLDALQRPNFNECCTDLDDCSTTNACCHLHYLFVVRFLRTFRNRYWIRTAAAVQWKWEHSHKNNNLQLQLSATTTKEIQWLQAQARVLSWMERRESPGMIR